MQSLSTLALSAAAMLLALFGSAVGQGCSSAGTCADCLDVAHDCQWCSDLDQAYETTLSRCATSFTSCQNVTSITSRPPRNTMAAPIGPTVQVTPQKISVEARSKDTLTVRVELEPADNFPLDVYYLMDHSFSFDDDLSTLQQQAENIANAIQNVSKNFQIGFGSFVDKTIQPFVTTQGDQLVNQCRNCKLPYPFENTFPLSNSTQNFIAAVNTQTISGNLDSAEGVLDAMMQVLVCTDKIGWRDNARRVLVVGTDAVYHSAGDGRVAGVVLPNNAECQLDAKGQYTGYKTYDYPSIGQMNSVLEERDILVIFATAASAFVEYQLLLPRLEGSIVVELRQDSTNLEAILTSELRRQIREARPSILVEDGVRVQRIRADCPLNNPRDIIHIDGGKIQGCNNLGFGSGALFDVTLEVGSCAELRGTGLAVVRFSGFGDVEVNVTGLCDCPCESIAPVDNSSWCFNQGAEQCGLCDCRDGFSNAGTLGRCDCDLANFRPCIQNNSGLVCSGRGECICQLCQCRPLSNGSFCECDNGACARDVDGELCSGNGRCECGTCRCNEGYVGEACECATKNSNCIPPSGVDERLCSGQGTCQCGQCDCLSGYQGTYCEMCIRTSSQCDLDVCTSSRFCLELFYGINITNFDEFVKINSTFGPCSGIPVLLTEPVTPLPHTINDIPSTLCSATDPDGCIINYHVVSRRAVSEAERFFYPLQIDSVRECPQPVTPGGSNAFNYLPLVLGIVLGLLFAGILMLLIWRLYTWHSDKQEYNRFVKAQKAQDWSKAENPLYKNATQKFNNPTFGN